MLPFLLLVCNIPALWHNPITSFLLFLVNVIARYRIVCVYLLQQTSLFTN